MIVTLKLNIDRLIHALVGFVLGGVSAYITASIFNSLFVLSALQSVGAEIPIILWFKTIKHDMSALAFNGNYFSFANLVLMGFLIAMPAAVLTCKIIKLPPWLVYMAAGAAAIATIHGVGSAHLFGYSLIAGADGALGFGCQLLAGAFGGAVFYSIYKRVGRSV